MLYFDATLGNCAIISIAGHVIRDLLIRAVVRTHAELVDPDRLAHVVEHLPACRSIPCRRMHASCRLRFEYQCHAVMSQFTAGWPQVPSGCEPSASIWKNAVVQPCAAHDDLRRAVHRLHARDQTANHAAREHVGPVVVVRPDRAVDVADERLRLEFVADLVVLVVVAVRGLLTERVARVVGVVLAVVVQVPSSITGYTVTPPSLPSSSPSSRRIFAELRLYTSLR